MVPTKLVRGDARRQKKSRLGDVTISFARRLWIPAIVALISGCASSPAFKPRLATILVTGTIECFPAGVALNSGKPFTCETSAVERIGDQLLILNDKSPDRMDIAAAMWVPIPARTDRFIALDKIRYDERAVLRDARKFESMTVTPDGKWVLAWTSFDWPPAAESTEGDPYNVLVAWPVDRPEAAQIVHRSERGGVASSLLLRNHLGKTLADDRYPEGPPYYKIEGLAALPNHRLLIGVRELGDTYESFSYVTQIVAADYEIDQTGKLTIKEPLSPLVGLSEAQQTLEGHSLGLSGLVFDSKRSSLWMLTSFESADGVTENGALLWRAAVTRSGLGDFAAVTDANGKQIRFPYKSEGLTWLDDRTLFVVHDEDRRESVVSGRKRKLNEAIYSIVEVTD